MEGWSGVVQRRQILRALLMAVAMAALGFSILFSQHETAAALPTLGLSFLSLVLVMALHRGTPPEPVAFIYLVLFLAAVIAALLQPDLQHRVHSWLGIVAVLPYLLLRERLALWTALASLSAVGTACYLGAKTVAEPLSEAHLLHLMVPAVGVFLMFHFYMYKRSRKEAEILNRVTIDPLTQLCDREKLAFEFEREQKTAQQTRLPLSLILIDLDHFKALNDRHGHDAGDSALVFFSDILRRRVRKTDLPCRIGGEEFVVLLPNTTVSDGTRLAEELRHALETAPLHYQNDEIRLTLSAGVVELGRDGSNWLQLYRTADAFLYDCKKKGRNRVLSSTLAAAAGAAPVQPKPRQL